MIALLSRHPSRSASNCTRNHPHSRGRRCNEQGRMRRAQQCPKTATFPCLSVRPFNRLRPLFPQHLGPSEPPGPSTSPTTLAHQASAAPRLPCALTWKRHGMRSSHYHPLRHQQPCLCHVRSSHAEGVAAGCAPELLLLLLLLQQRVTGLLGEACSAAHKTGDKTRSLRNITNVRRQSRDVVKRSRYEFHSPLEGSLF